MLTAAAAMFAIALPFFYVFFAFLLPIVVMTEPYGGEPRREKVRRGLKALAVMPFFAAAFAPPFRLMTHAAHWVYPRIHVDTMWHEAGLRLFPWFDWWIGGCGLVLFGGGAFVSWYRNLRVVRDIENLPTSKARSAAIGLAEFQGVARPLDGSTDATKPILRRYEPYSSETGERVTVLKPFYLEDDTGRIRVDPTGAEFDYGFRIRFLDPVRFLYLNERVESDDNGVDRRLLPGDPVYVVGAVEENPDAPPNATDADRLVVRPSSSWVKPNLIQRLIPDSGSRIPGMDVQDVFFLSDSDELTAAELMRDVVSKTWKFAAFWATTSAALLWLAF